jgi:hypothetical protein
MGQSKWVLFHNFEQIQLDQPRYGTFQISWSSAANGEPRQPVGGEADGASSQATKLPPAKTGDYIKVAGKGPQATGSPSLPYGLDIQSSPARLSSTGADCRD